MSKFVLVIHFYITSFSQDHGYVSNHSIEISILRYQECVQLITSKKCHFHSIKEFVHFTICFKVIFTVKMSVSLFKKPVASQCQENVTS
jgi:hypothetical protein